MAFPPFETRPGPWMQHGRHSARFHRISSSDMPMAAPIKGAPSLVLLLGLVLAVSMAGAPRRHDVMHLAFAHHAPR